MTNTRTSRTRPPTVAATPAQRAEVRSLLARLTRFVPNFVDESRKTLNDAWLDRNLDSTVIVEQWIAPLTVLVKRLSDVARNGIHLYTRENEILLSILCENAGLCSRCKKPLTKGKFCWNRRITQAMYFGGRPFIIGEEWFSDVRHTDGTLCVDNRSAEESRSIPGMVPGGFYSCQPMAQCSKCKAYESFTVKQEPYGDRTTCQVCGDSSYFSIGD